MTDVQQDTWNGQAAEAPVMVSFGPQAYQSVHLATAEYMLTELARRNPKLFRELYGFAVLGDQ